MDWLTWGQIEGKREAREERQGQARLGERQRGTLGRWGLGLEREDGMVPGESAVQVQHWDPRAGSDGAQFRPRSQGPRDHSCSRRAGH